MLPTPPLSPQMTVRALQHLGVSPADPDLALLDRLIAAYIRRVPWESAFRIAKRARTADTAACPRFAEEFWTDATERGGGGTCFESNYAFFSLLRALGYEGYLTVNNMDDFVGCHTAIVVKLDGERWLVDAGYPLHLALPIREEVTRREGPFHTYTITPSGTRAYTLTRDRHPSPYIFTLIDAPVDEAAYRGATIADYGQDGLFLDKLVINKVVDEQLWRFNSAESSSHLQRFENGTRIDTPMEGDVAAALASRFGVDEATVRAALDVLAAKRN